jgi:hypothetical protein
MIREGERARSATDAAAEAHLAHRLGLAWGLQVVPRPPDDVIDFDVLRPSTGKRVAVCELKDRDCRMGEYPNIWVNATKARALEQAQSTLGVVGLFVIRARKEDRLYVVRAAALAQCERGIGVRSKPRANGVRVLTDTMEEVVQVPTAMWKLVVEPEQTARAW